MCRKMTEVPVRRLQKPPEIESCVAKGWKVVDGWRYLSIDLDELDLISVTENRYGTQEDTKTIVSTRWAR